MAYTPYQNGEGQSLKRVRGDSVRGQMRFRTERWRHGPHQRRHIVMILGQSGIEKVTNVTYAINPRLALSGVGSTKLVGVACCYK